MTSEAVKTGKQRRNKGEGNFYFEKDRNRWRGSFQPDIGKRETIIGHVGESWKAFKTRFDKAKRNAEEGLKPSKGKGTFASFLEDVWLPDVRDRVSKGELAFLTKQSYEDTVASWLVPAIGEVKLTDLTREHIRSAMKLAADAGRALRTVNYVRDIARIALNAAMDADLIVRNVAARTKNERAKREGKNSVKEYKSNQVYTAEEIAAFTEKAGLRANGLLVVLGVNLGLRRGELLGLMWADFDETKGTLFIRRQLLTMRGDRYTNAERDAAELEGRSLLTRKPSTLLLTDLKSKSSRRMMKLPPFLVIKLNQHRRAQLKLRMKKGGQWQDQGLVFPSTKGGLMQPRNAQRMYDSILKAASVDKKRLHDLRHTAATVQFEGETNEFAVMALLGHSSVRVTREVYGHVTSPMSDKAVSLMEANYQSGKGKKRV